MAIGRKKGRKHYNDDYQGLQPGAVIGNSVQSHGSRPGLVKPCYGCPLNHCWLNSISSAACLVWTLFRRGHAGP